MSDITDDIRLTNINFDVDRGGWECRFEVLSDTDLFVQGRKCTIMCSLAFDGPPGAPFAAFSGYSLPIRFSFDRIGSVVSAVAQTSDCFLRNGFVQGLGFIEVPARSNYHEFDTGTMNLGELVRHVLGYYDSGVDIGPNWVAHTSMVLDAVHNPQGWITLDDVTVTSWPVDPDGSMLVSDYNIHEADNNLWSRICEVAEAEFFRAYFGKYDDFHYKKHPMYASVIPDPVMTFDMDFYIDKPVVHMYGDERPRQVLMKAITDTQTVLESEFPDSPTHVYGQVEELYRLRCNSQAMLDEWCTRHYYFMNRECQLTWIAPGACGLCFEGLDRVLVDYTGTDANGVHLDFDDEPFWIHKISTDFLDGFTAKTSFVLEQENIPE